MEGESLTQSRKEAKTQKEAVNRWHDQIAQLTRRYRKTRPAARRLARKESFSPRSFLREFFAAWRLCVRFSEPWDRPCPRPFIAHLRIGGQSRLVQFNPCRSRLRPAIVLSGAFASADRAAYNSVSAHAQGTDQAPPPRGGAGTSQFEICRSIRFDLIDPVLFTS